MFQLSTDGILLEGVLILQNSSLKFNTVAGNAILLNYAVSSENISESIKIQTENGFQLKVIVCKFRWNKIRPENSRTADIYFAIKKAANFLPPYCYLSITFIHIQL